VDTSRRTVIKAAGHAAWMTPVVVAASSAPAFAGTGQPQLLMDITSATTPSVTGLTILTESLITNLGDQATTNLTVILRIELDSATMWGSTPVASAPGWQIGSASGTSTSRIRTFSAQAQVELGASGSPTASQSFNPTITTNSVVVPAGTVTMMAYPEIGALVAMDVEPIVATG
jgi:hypothetical protein